MRSSRALDALIPALLLKHEYISHEEHQAIQTRLKLDMLSHRKEAVGHYEIILKLNEISNLNIKNSQGYI